MWARVESRTVYGVVSPLRDQIDVPLPWSRMLGGLPAGQRPQYAVEVAYGRNYEPRGIGVRLLVDLGARNPAISSLSRDSLL